MTLEEQLENIQRNTGNNQYLSVSFDKRHSPTATIEDFWKEFIEPRILNPLTVIKWNELLYRYVEENDAIFAIRGFHEYNPKQPELFRRGFYTKVTNDNYSFFYTDNSFAYYFYKMAYNDFCPEYEEFKSFMLEHKFPYKYKIVGNNGPEEEYADVFPIGTKNPEITGYYKLAHIFDAGTNYFINNNPESRENMCTKYFPRDDIKKWQKCAAGYHVRDLQIDENEKASAKEWLKAQFLRFISPMNYFLAPKTNHKSRIYNIYWKTKNTISFDIGEDPNLISFVKQRMHEKFTITSEDGTKKDYYQEFLDKILPNPDTINEKGNTIINIIYSATDLKEEYKNSAKSQSKNNSSSTKQNSGKKSKKTSSKQTIGNTNNAALSENSKAMARLGKWTDNKDTKVHKILKEFIALEAKSPDKEVKITDLENVCSEANHATISSLSTDAGNSYGAAFTKGKNKDYIKFTDNIDKNIDRSKF